jgi:hypothetical protein
MRIGHWLMTITCGLAMAGSGCNQRVAVLDQPTGSTGPTPPAPGVASVLITPGAINAGGSVRGTVLLTGPATGAGVNVSLSASDDAATVDSAVTVAAGASSREFTVGTRVVPNDRQVVITASTPDRSVSGSFSVWAEAPVFFTYFSEPGDFVGGGGFGRFTQGSATFNAYCDRNTLNVQVRVPGPRFWSARFSGPAGVPLRPGTYEGATRASFNTATPGLDVSGESRGCSSVGGRFVIHDIDLQNNRVHRFHASFVQRCGTNPGLLTGEIRVANMPESSSVVNCQR